MNNRDIKDFFISYLEDRNYNNHDGRLSKGYVIINFMANGKMIRATDENPNHSHKHIVSCLTPTNKEDADCWFRLLDIEKKEVGSNAWNVIKKRDFNNQKNS